MISFVVGTAACVYYCSGNQLFYNTIGPVYLVISFILNINLIVCFIVAKLYYPNQDKMIRKLLFIGSSLLVQFFLALPLLFRIYDNLINGSQEPISDGSLIWNHIFYMMIGLTGAVFFASFYPERCLPGRCDILGHSHQIFHVLSSIMSLYQLHAGYQDYKAQPHDKLVKLNASFTTTFGGLILTGIFGAIIVTLFVDQFWKHIQKGQKKF